MKYAFCLGGALVRVFRLDGGGELPVDRQWVISLVSFTLADGPLNNIPTVLDAFPLFWPVIYQNERDLGHSPAPPLAVLLGHYR